MRIASVTAGRLPRRAAGRAARARGAAVTWIWRPSRCQAIAPSTESRSSQNCSASACVPELYVRAMSNAQPVWCISVGLTPSRPVAPDATSRAAAVISSDVPGTCVRTRSPR